MTFSNEDIIEYYHATQSQYELGWNLKKYLAMHYGIWDNTTKNFGESLINTNRKIAELSQIKSGERVLDAGCGFGGTAIYIHQVTGAKITGITLSDKQVKVATEEAIKRGISESVDFKTMDFCNTEFEKESFDVIYACESICYAPDHRDFLKECFRILKPGGRLVVSGYFLTAKGKEKDDSNIRKWMDSWAMISIESDLDFEKKALEENFLSVNFHDFTKNVDRSSRRMYFGGYLSAPAYELYLLFNPKTSRFAKRHYRSGIYGHRAKMKGLWSYKIAVTVK